MEKMAWRVRDVRQVLLTLRGETLIYVDKGGEEEVKLEILRTVRVGTVRLANSDEHLALILSAQQERVFTAAEAWEGDGK